MVSVRSEMMLILTAGGIEACSTGIIALIRLDGVDDVGAGLALDRQDDRALVLVVPAGDQIVLRRADGAADIADADRRSVSIGDHQIGVIVGVQQLVVGVAACRSGAGC